MNFLGIVTSGAVRGVLGVEETELPDEVFLSTRFEIELRIETEGWLPEAIAEVCSQAASGVAGYANKLDLLRLYAQYVGAVLISPHLHLGVAEDIGDGQNAFSRQKAAIGKAIAAAAARAAGHKSKLEDAYSQTAAERTSFFGSASPSYDSVTDETA